MSECIISRYKINASAVLFIGFASCFGCFSFIGALMNESLIEMSYSTAMSGHSSVHLGFSISFSSLCHISYQA